MDNLDKDVINISNSAAQALKNLSSLHMSNIRLSVKTGGCSGFKYNLDFARHSLPFEETIVIDETFKLFIDPKAIMYIMGTEMDYEEDDFKSGFIFRNPNEKAKCGCGKSFGV